MSKEENKLYLQDLNMIYEEHRQAKNRSLCDKSFDIRNLLLIFGATITLFSAAMVHQM
jgi:hypothetical protein